MSQLLHSDNTLLDRYNQFMNVVNDPSVPPPRVYDPLSQKQLDEIKLIREVSAVLQKTKDDEELKKIKDAEDEAQVDEKKEENSKEDNSEPKQE